MSSSPKPRPWALGASSDRSFVRSWVVVGLVFLGQIFTGTAEAIPPDDEPWVAVQSSHFTVISGAGAIQGRRVADELETLRWALHQITTLEVLSPIPIRVYVFPNDRSLHPYKHLYHGAPASMSGAFYGGDDLDILTLHGSRGREASLAVKHEYLHSVVRNNLPGLPLWLEEGMAELFSTFFTVEGEGRLGRSIPWHERALRRAGDLPLLTLLGVGPESEQYQQFERQALFYARAWELTHFLFLGNGERRLQALEYVALVRQGVEAEVAFVRAFGVEPAQLEQELRAYREAGFEVRRLRLGSIPSPELSQRPLEYGELLQLLGDLLLHQGGRREEATFHYQQALARAQQVTALGARGKGADGEPASPRPMPGWAARAAAGLGGLMERGGDYASARAQYRRALEMAPNDAVASYRYGASLLILGRATSEAKLREAYGHLETSITTDPTYIPAWLALRRVVELIGKPKEGQALEQRLQARPETLLASMLLHVRQGREGDAVALRDWLSSSHGGRPPRSPASSSSDSPGQGSNREGSAVEESARSVEDWLGRADKILARIRWLGGNAQGGPRRTKIDLLRSVQPAPPKGSEAPRTPIQPPS